MQAQPESRFWIVEEIKVKDKKAKEFELELKEIAVSLNIQKYPYSYILCKSTDNTYFKFTKLSSLNEIDHLNTLTKNAYERIDHKTSRHYKRCIQTTKTFVIKDIPEFNHIPENPRIEWKDVKFSIWEIHMLKKDQRNAYLNNLKKFQAIKKKYNHNDPSFVFEVIKGNESSTIALLSYGRDQKDRQFENSRLWQVVGDEGKFLFESLFPFIQDQEFLDFWILDDLSYEPEVDEFNM